MSASFSNLKIRTRISLGVVIYTVICTFIYVPLTLWDSKKTLDNIVANEVSRHFNILYPIAADPANSLEKLSRYFDVYQKRNGVDIALYMVDGNNIEIGLSTLGSKPLLENQVYRSAKPSVCDVITLTKETQHFASCHSAIKNENGEIVAILEVIKNTKYYDTVLLDNLKHQLAFSVVIILLSIVVSRIISLSIATPIIEITRLMGYMAKGDSHVHIPTTTQKDEVGDMARALKVLREHMQEFERVTELRANEQNLKLARQQHMEESIREFDSNSSSVIQHVSAAVDQLTSVAGSASGSAKQATDVIKKALSTSTNLSSNVQTVASAAEQLSTSIQEIDGQVSHSITIAKQAVRDVSKTNDTVAGLSDAAQKIGNVVSTISDIAEQTNLLALNATIEAARAGDAGKGFAVVASEVKQLANQTEKATQEIAAQINAIQDNTSNAVQAMKNINKVIEEMDSISSVIALAIQEQAKATQEITRHVIEAADGTKLVNRNISDVADVTQKADNSSHQVVEVANKLFEQGQQLQSTIQSFLRRINVEKTA